MRREKKNRQIGKDQHVPIKNTHEQTDPGKEALRILSKWIAEAYLDEIAHQRQVMIGAKPPVYVETIHVTSDSVNINDSKERQKLHTAVDQALDAMILRILDGNRASWVFKKGEVTVKMKV